MLNLNLLSPTKKAWLKDLRLTRKVAMLALKLIGLLVLQAGILYAVDTQLQQKRITVETELESIHIVSPSGKTLPVSETTRSLNADLAVLKTVANTPMLDELLVSISNAIPDGVRLTKVSLTTTTLELQLAGVAQARQEIPILQEQLSQIHGLVKPAVQYNLNERTDIAFTVVTAIQFSNQ